MKLTDHSLTHYSTLEFKYFQRISRKIDYQS